MSGPELLALLECNSMAQYFQELLLGNENGTKLPHDNASWPTAVVGEADRPLTLSASACHIGGPKGV